MTDDKDIEETPEISSYSDPIYDRLEGCNKILSKYWLPLSLAIVGIVIAVLVVRNAQQNNPDSASASAYLKASNDSENTALVTLLGNAQITDEFHCHAALNLIQRSIDSNDLDQARTYHAQARTLSASIAADVPYLQAHVALALAAIETQAGNFDAALSAYDTAEKLARGTTYASASGYAAQYNRAMIHITLADAQADAAIAADLRSQAYTALETLRFKSDLNNSPLLKGVTYAFYDLLRNHPELADDTDAASEAVAEEVTEKTQADTDTETETQAPAQTEAK